MIALSALNQDGDLIAAGTQDHSLESGNINSTAQRVCFNTSVQLRVCSICADQKQSKDTGSARVVIQTDFHFME